MFSCTCSLPIAQEIPDVQVPAGSEVKEAQVGEL